MATPNSDGILLLSLAGVYPVPVSSVVALVMSISPLQEVAINFIPKIRWDHSLKINM